MNIPYICKIKSSYFTGSFCKLNHKASFSTIEIKLIFKMVGGASVIHYDLVKSLVRSQEQWLWDIAWKSNVFVLFLIVLRIIQLHRKLKMSRVQLLTDFPRLHHILRYQALWNSYFTMVVGLRKHLQVVYSLNRPNNHCLIENIVQILRIDEKVNGTVKKLIVTYQEGIV